MKKLLKWAGIGLGALVALVVLLYAVGSSTLGRTYEVQLASLTTSSDSAVLAHGAHLTHILGCTDCHGEDLGGRVFVDAPPFRVTASNLTLGGVGARYSAQDFDRAIRHGIRPDGRSLVIMPSAAYHKMSDEDAAALISYLMTVPAVENDLPPTEIRTLGRVLVAAAVVDPAFEVRTEPARAGASPPAGPTAEYGAYLASFTCSHCHGEDLRGNPKPPAPESPPAPDLAAAGNWTIDQFKQTLRTGVTPGGREMNPEFMPWTATAHMTDVELEALHAHLATLAD